MWYPPTNPPKHGVKVICHVPELRRTGMPKENTLVFGRWNQDLQEFQIEGSPSKWIVARWHELPSLPLGE